MRNTEPNRSSLISGGEIWIIALLAVVVVVGLVVWMTSDPTNRTASPDAPATSTTGAAPKSPPASSPADPAPQSSQR
jgi:hypothetical protein